MTTSNLPQIERPLGRVIHGSRVADVIGTYAFGYPEVALRYDDDETRTLRSVTLDDAYQIEAWTRPYCGRPGFEVGGPVMPGLRANVERWLASEPVEENEGPWPTHAFRVSLTVPYEGPIVESLHRTPGGAKSRVEALVADSRHAEDIERGYLDLRIDVIDLEA